MRNHDWYEESRFFDIVLKSVSEIQILMICTELNYPLYRPFHCLRFNVGRMVYSRLY